MGSLAASALELDAIADDPGKQISAQATAIIPVGMNIAAIELLNLQRAHRLQEWPRDLAALALAWSEIESQIQQRGGDYPQRLGAVNELGRWGYGSTGGAEPPSSRQLSQWP